MKKLDAYLTLEHWNKAASVRVKPYTYSVQMSQDRLGDTKDWYPRAMLPFLTDGLLRNVSEERVRKILAHHLVYFLDYTTLLEHLMVNRSLEVIVHDMLEVGIPEVMRAAGLQIYTDEGYHALFSNQLAAEVATLYSVERNVQVPMRIEKLNALISGVPQELVGVMYFAIGFVSETVIAKEIASIKSDCLIPQVYSLLKDHLEDETVHAYFFTKAFEVVWQGCSKQQRDTIAFTLPSLLRVFCCTDTAWLSNVLMEARVPAVTTKAIVEQMEDRGLINKKISSAASMTISTLRKNGFFDDAEYAHCFKVEGLPYV
ncbi:diiron oxygenase [Pseudomonas caspiana]